MKLSLAHKKINRLKKLHISDIGKNPDIDWIVVVNFCLILLIPCIWYSVSLFNSVSEERVTTESVQVENISLNKEGMDNVVSKYILKSQDYRNVVSGSVTKIPDPSI